LYAFSAYWSEYSLKPFLRPVLLQGVAWTPHQHTLNTYKRKEEALRGLATREAIGSPCRWFENQKILGKLDDHDLRNGKTPD
jgi:hypothetical protein